MPRLAVLQINQLGSWRNSVRFDVDTADYAALEAAAVQLVQAADPQGRASLRTVVADSQPTIVLRHWDARKGWRDWIDP